MSSLARAAGTLTFTGTQSLFIRIERARIAQGFRLSFQSEGYCTAMVVPAGLEAVPTVSTTGTAAPDAAPVGTTALTCLCAPLDRLKEPSIAKIGFTPARFKSLFGASAASPVSWNVSRLESKRPAPG